MPAMRFAGLARSYRYPQANRRNCPSSLLRDSAASGRRGISYRERWCALLLQLACICCQNFPVIVMFIYPAGGFTLAGFHAPRIEVSLC